MFQKQHDKLMKVFQKFRELFQKEMQYLEHIVLPEGVTMDPEKLHAVW
jgi:hypothetical protein